MDPELSCEKCGWSPDAGPDPSAVACPKCGGILTAASDESTVAWAPRGEPLPAPDDSDQTEFLVGDSGPGDSLEIGRRTTVQDLALVPSADQGPPASDIGLAVVEAPVGPAAAGPAMLLSDSAPSIATLEPVNAAAVAPASFPAQPTPAGRMPDSGRGGPSPFTFRLIVSYASAVTLACLYLLYLVSKGAPSLDLPDLAPPVTKANRVTTLLYVPPDQVVPPAHQLKLGESQRYGSLRVTPLRVTRGPLSFAYFDPAIAESRADSGPVLKLHLQLENASRDQDFVPLDRQLVFTKEPDKKRLGNFKANNFLCSVSDRSDLDRHVQVYDLAPDSSWVVRGENLDRELKAGETMEVFIPTTEEGWEDLQGDLVWRVHLRKGYNRHSLRGVTTLVEVRFRRSDIVDETSAAPGSDV